MPQAALVKRGEDGKLYMKATTNEQKPKNKKSPKLSTTFEVQMMLRKAREEHNI